MTLGPITEHRPEHPQDLVEADLVAEADAAELAWRGARGTGDSARLHRKWALALARLAARGCAQ